MSFSYEIQKLKKKNVPNLLLGKPLDIFLLYFLKVIFPFLFQIFYSEYSRQKILNYTSRVFNFVSSLWIGSLPYNENLCLFIQNRTLSGLQIAMTSGNDTKENSSVSRLFRLYSNIIKVEMLLRSRAKKVKTKQTHYLVNKRYSFW